MKNLFFLLSLLSLTTLAQECCQLCPPPPPPPVAVAFSKAIGGSESDSAVSTVADSQGNIFVAVNIRGTVGSLTSNGETDWMIAKYSPTGTLVWMKNYGGTSSDNIRNIAIDPQGNVVATGLVSPGVNLGGGTLPVTGSYSIGVAKYKGSDGTHMWSKTLNASVGAEGSAIAVDSTGKIYVTGYFRGTMTWGNKTIQVPFSSDLDVFIGVLTDTGTPVTATNFTNTGNERGYAISVDSAGNIVIGGYFSNSVNFGGGEFSSPNAMTDVFLASFKFDGTKFIHNWSKKYGAPDGNEQLNSLAIDKDGNVVAVGSAIKAIDLGGGLLPSKGGSDSWIVSLTQTGSYRWSDRFGGLSNDYGLGVAVDTTGQTFMTGYFDSSFTAGQTTLTSRGQADSYIVKLNSLGAVQTLRQFGGSAQDVSQSVTTSPTGWIALTGYFFGTGFFNGTNDTVNGALTSSGQADAFLMQIEK